MKFVGARNDEAKFVAHKSKYEPINGGFGRRSEREDKEDVSGKGKKEERAEKSDEKDIKMGWKKVMGESKGFRNYGNTCFMNSALQCLINSAALVQLLMEEEEGGCTHGKLRREGANGTNGFSPLGAPKGKFCCYCELRKLMQRVYGEQSRGKKSIAPEEMARNLRQIGSTFRAGRQEDAHEFLRELISKCDEAAAKHTKRCLNYFERPVARLLPGEAAPPPSPKPTSLFFALFGSYLRSRVTCGRCGYHSDTFDPYMDLSVELSKHSLERCLQHFTAPEQLDLDNMYTCGSCKRKSQPVKRIQIWQPPNLLAIHLKRFNIFGKKIHKEINYPETLDFTPYFCEDSPYRKSKEKLSFDAASSSPNASTSSPNHPRNNPNLNNIYHLYAVLLHHGMSSRSGHYTAAVKASNGVWMDANDDYMTRDSLKRALSHSQDAYILFYARANAIPSNRPPSSISSPSLDTSRRFAAAQQQFLSQDDSSTQRTQNGTSKVDADPKKKTFSKLADSKKEKEPDSSSEEQSSESYDSDSEDLSPEDSDKDATTASDDDEEAEDSDSSESEEEVAPVVSISSGRNSNGVKKSETIVKKTIMKGDIKTRRAEAMRMLFGGHVPLSVVQQLSEPPTSKQNPKKRVREAYDASIWKSEKLYGGSQVRGWEFDQSDLPNPPSGDSTMLVDPSPPSIELSDSQKAKKMHNRSMMDLQLIAKENKKTSRSAYDIDYDRGRIKKVKRKEDSTPSNSGSYAMHKGSEDGNKFQKASDSRRSPDAQPSRKANFKGGSDRVKRLQREEKRKQQGGGAKDGKPAKPYFKKAFWKNKKR